MTRRFRIPLLGHLALVALVVVAGCQSAPPPPPPPAPLHLVVLHTNDVHGQVLPRPALWIDRDAPPGAGGLPRLAAEVARVRSDVEREGGEVLVVDAGDWFQGTPEGLVERGAGFVEALAAVGYDAMCVGNHEFDLGVGPLRDLLATTDVPHIAANLLERDSGERLAWTKPFRVVDRGGLRIALVGLVTPLTPEISHPESSTILFEDPIATLGRLMPRLEERADLVIPLTHLGLPDDLRLAREFPSLALIVGGHSHTYLEEGVREGEVLVVQAGDKATVLGRVDLWIDRASGGVLRSEASLVQLLDEPIEAHRSPRVESLCALLVARSSALMDVVVGTLAAPLDRGRDQTSGGAGNLVTDAMRARVGADVALQNRGGLRTDLPGGEVTRRDLFGLLPFGNTLVVLELSGARLFESVRRAVEGEAHSGVEFSGMDLVVDRTSEGAVRLVAIELGDEPLDELRIYRVATNSFLAGGGDGYLDTTEETPVLDTGLVLREVLEEVFRGGEAVQPPLENRYRVAEAVR